MAGDRFELPQALVESLAQFPSPERRSWLDALPGTVADLADRWSLTVGRPYQPGGQVSWVAPALTATGDAVVLKVGWAHREATQEAEGLRRWDGRGAVRVHEAAAFNDSNALLLERCDPGAPLAARPEEEQDVVVAGLLRRLWAAPAEGPFSTLAAMCQAWADEHEAEAASGMLPGGPGNPLDAGIARAGIELFRGLPSTASRTALLCTDLHAENILAAQREPWLVIDPKPHLGDPTYDTVQHMLNCRGRLATDPEGFARRMADLAGVDPDRQVQWLFARCVQESMEHPELATVARALASKV